MPIRQETAIYSGCLARKIDHIAIEEYSHAGFDLMMEAGERAFAVLQSLQSASDMSSSLSLLILCGAGNNGGDGYVIARCALQAQWSVSLIAAGEPKTEDAIQAKNQYLEAGGCVLSATSEQAEAALQSPYDIIVDALIGVGLSSALRNPLDDLVHAVNQKTGFKVAVDVPSGVNADTGAVYTPAFQADITLTFIVHKLGLMTGAALGCVGEVILLELDIEQDAIDRVECVAKFIQAPTLRRRLEDSHKGSYGHCVVAGGQEGMLGAVLLSGKAALRCGSGKVTVLTTSSHMDKPALYSPELMSAKFVLSDEDDAFDKSVLRDADAIAVGPGLGLCQWSDQLFCVALAADKPMVIDADALNLLARTGRRTSAETVLTPHPGEAARLLNCRTTDIQANRLQAALKISERYGGICVLKGAGTIIANAEGVPQLCNLGNAGMATAGMGDVLSGMIASFLGQGYDAFAAACMGVWLHAKAADDWCEKHAAPSLIASDVIDQLPETLRQISA